MKLPDFDFTLYDCYKLPESEILMESLSCAERRAEYLFPEHRGTVRTTLFATVENNGLMGKTYYFYGYLE